MRFLLAFLFFSVFTASAEETAKYKVSGMVVDENTQPIPYASVGLYRLPDSSLVGSMASGMDGKFSIEADKGSFYLQVTFLSYQTKYISGITIANKSVDLQNIQLAPGALKLDEVNVVGEKSQMKLQLDKRVFTVGKDLANTGSNASEILDNVPSINVDVEGNVSLRGSQNVRILVDGKPSGLVGSSPADALRQLQGSLVESIEVITNPSARYDAEGEVGIINIVLKKERKDGVNGSFEVSGGYPANYGASYSINYRKKKFNLFSSYGLSYRRSPGSGYSIQQYTGDSIYSFERIREHERGGLSNNIRLGSDYFLNNKNIFTLSGIYKHTDGSNRALLIYKDFDANNDLSKTVTRDEDEEEDRQNIEGEITYKKLFDKKGREWTSTVKYIYKEDHENSILIESYDIDVPALNQTISNIEDSKDWLFQTDYVHPISKEGKFETGLKSTQRFIDNNYSVDQEDTLGNWSSLEKYTNHFLYSELIHAAYVMAGNKSGKFSYQGGLRAEYTDVTTELTNTKEINPRKYWGLFPSAHFAYELDSMNTLQLSYSRRLGRPSFWNLVPFYGFSDNRSFFSGNPDLDPEYTNSFELGYLRYFEKGSILSSIYYRHRTGVIERITIVDSTVFSRIIPINYAVQDAYGAEFSFNYDFYRWWKVDGSLNLYYEETRGSYEDMVLSNDAFNWSTKLNTKFVIKKKWNTQASLDYRAPRNTAQGRNKARYSVNLGINRDVLKGNGTITFSVKDLFNTRKWMGETIGEDFYFESEFQWRARQFLVSFNYRLNQKKKRGGPPRDFDGGGMF